MTAIFRDERARETMIAAYDRFRARVPDTRTRTVKTRFGETHILEAGRDDAPPLVLLHGALATSAHVMGEVVRLFDRFHVYAVDVMGQSVKSADVRLELTTSAYGDWTVDVLDALGLERPHVYGVSWGGFVARKLAEVAPARIDRLVLMVPAGFVTGSAWRGFRQVWLPMTLYRTFPSPSRLMEFSRAMLSTMDEGWIHYFGEALLCYKMDMRIPPLATPAQLAHFKRPTLVFGASDDVSFPGAELVARAKQLLPHAEVELLEGSKHSPPTDEATRAKLCDRVSRFLTQAEA